MGGSGRERQWEREIVCVGLGESGSGVAECGIGAGENGWGGRERVIVGESGIELENGSERERKGAGTGENGSERERQRE